jgi:hypothetical protein
VNPTWLYVGVIYALAIWLARRSGVSISWRVASFFYLLVLLYMWKSMTGGWVSIPIDIVHTLPPWWRIRHVKSSLNAQMNDIVLQIIPWAHQSREALKSFTAPLWNSMTGCGYPLMANGQSAPFSIVRILTLPLPLAYAVTAEAAMKVLVGLTFTYLLARRRGYEELPSVIGAVCFGFCAFVHVWLHFPLGTAAAFIPAAVYSIDLLAEQVTYRRFLFTAILWTVMLYNGHPETVSHAAFLSAIYLFWIVFVEKHPTKRTWREFIPPLAGSAGAIACAGFMAMPFILPFLEALPRSKRYQQLLVSPNVIGIFSDWPSKILLLQPAFFGHVPLEKAWAGAASAEGIEGFAGILGVAGAVALLIRAIRYRKFRDREFFYVVATFIFLSIILGWPGIADAFHFLFKLAANARLRSILCFLVSIQAAAALDFALREKAWPYLLGLLTAATGFFFLINYVPFPGPYEKSGSFLSLWPSMIVLAVAALVPLAAGRQAILPVGPDGQARLPALQQLAMMLLLVAVINEMFASMEGWNPNEPIELFYPKTPIIEAMEKIKAAHPPSDPFRIVGLGPALFPNLNAMYGFEDVRVHDPMANGRYLGVLRVRGDYDPVRYFAKWENMDSRMLDYLNVRYVIADVYEEVKDPSRFREIYSEKDGRIFENLEALPRFFQVPNVVLEFKRERFAKLLVSQPDFRDTAFVNKLTVDSNRERLDLLAPRPRSAPQARVALGGSTSGSTAPDFRMHVSAPRYTMIVSSQPFWPGWRVESNGRSLRPVEVNGAFLGFVVPPGENNVRVWYAPWSWRIGVAIALLTALGLWVAGAFQFPAVDPARRRGITHSTAT